MSHYKPYPDYKRAGVPWIKTVPVHWASRKIAHSFKTIGSGTTPPTSEARYYSDAGTPWVTTGELRERTITATAKFLTPAALSEIPTLRVYAAGSLVMAMYGATIGRLGILGVSAATNQACCVMSDPISLEVRFAFYWFLAFKQALIDVFAVGGGQPNINQEIVTSLRLPAPGRSEQQEICIALDNETSRIDALIGKKSHFIELLKEKRQAVITRAVTKGIDPNAKMKDSDVEWLGELPAHWTMPRIKHCLKLVGQGWSPQCQSYPAEEGEWGVLKVGCVNGGIFDRTENKALPKEMDPQPELSIKAGDLLISRANTRELVGSAAVVKRDEPMLLLCDKLYRFRAYPEVSEVRFVALYLGTPGVRGQVEIEATGTSSSMLNISQATILELVLPLPPLAEQRAIVAYVEKEVGRLDRLIRLVGHSIDRLIERRAALITAAVTGQIDLRGAA